MARAPSPLTRDLVFKPLIWNNIKYLWGEQLIRDLVFEPWIWSNIKYLWGEQSPARVLLVLIRISWASGSGYRIGSQKKKAPHGFLLIIIIIIIIIFVLTLTVFIWQPDSAFFSQQNYKHFLF